MWGFLDSFAWKYLISGFPLSEIHGNLVGELFGILVNTISILVRVIERFGKRLQNGVHYGFPHDNFDKIDSRLPQ